MSTITLTQYYALDSRYSQRDAEIIGPELRRLAERGVTTMEDIVEASRAPRARLHDYFEWDDETAAEKYRLTQAGYMTRSIAVRIVTSAEPDAKPQEVRAFHWVPISETEARAVAVEAAPVEDEDETPAPAYRPQQRRLVTIEQAMSNERLASQIIGDALKQLASWKQRYETYRETLPNFDDRFEPVFEAIDRVLVAD